MVTARKIEGITEDLASSNCFSEWLFLEPSVFLFISPVISILTVCSLNEWFFLCRQRCASRGVLGHHVVWFEPPAKYTTYFTLVTGYANILSSLWLLRAGELPLRANKWPGQVTFLLDYCRLNFHLSLLLLITACIRLVIYELTSWSK